MLYLTSMDAEEWKGDTVFLNWQSLASANIICISWIQTGASFTFLLTFALLTPFAPCFVQVASSLWQLLWGFCSWLVHFSLYLLSLCLCWEHKSLTPFWPFSKLTYLSLCLSSRDTCLVTFSIALFAIHITFPKKQNSSTSQHPPLDPYYSVNRYPSEDRLALSKVQLSSCRARLTYLNIKYFYSELHHP